MYEFKDDSGRWMVYVHHDGYPTGAAQKFTATLKSGLAWELPRFEADEFAAAFVAANKKQPGSIRLLSGPQEATDIEFYYIVSQAANEGKLIIDAQRSHFGANDQHTGCTFYTGPLAAFIKDAEKIEQREQETS